MCTGKCVLRLKVKVRDTCSQLPNSRIYYKFNKDLHNLSLTQGKISGGLVSRKLMTFENRLELVNFVDVGLRQQKNLRLTLTSLSPKISVSWR